MTTTDKPRTMLTRFCSAVAVSAVMLGTAVLAAPAASAAPLATGAPGSAFTMYDVDGNGLDPHAADTTGPAGVPDGHVDQNVITVGGRLLWLYDENQDWQPDKFGNDNNGDGRADLWGLDPNQDWRPDSWLFDPAVFAAAPTFGPGMTITIVGQPLGTSWTDLVDTVNNQGGIVTDPCAFYNGMALAGSNIGCGYRPA